ncbi:MAG: patatin-like protein [Croceibacterium sp.]
MGQKELRIALICYGGVSLAVYMHGVTKEVWKLARASRALGAGDERPSGVEGAYHDLLRKIAEEEGLRLRVLPDIITGASAGGINAVFLAQALHSGQNLEALTELWLESADVDRLIDPEARMPWRYSKVWAQPLASWLLRRPGNAVSESVSPETRSEVRRKVSHLIRSRWFEPPFSGPGFSRLIHDALQAMASGEPGPPLLPPGHPVDLLVTATDFHGFLEPLHLHSPPLVEESEHRLPIAFRARTPAQGGQDLADPLELTFAARATASFPGAFPPLQLNEIDALAAKSGLHWRGRGDFVKRIMPAHVHRGTEEHVSLIDGSVLVNAPFGAAMNALPARPAQREVDRRFVYIDPTPERASFGSLAPHDKRPVGFFGAIIGSLSAIPREQPIRDNLEQLEHQSREAARLRQIAAALRPEVEATVEKLFGLTLFLDRPNPKRLIAWRQKAQQSAAESAGYAFHGYAQAKFAGVVEHLAETVKVGAPEAGLTLDAIAGALRTELDRRGLATLAAPGGGATAEAIAFLRAHDLRFRIRRLRLIARRLSREWEADPDTPVAALEAAREAIYRILALYFGREGADPLGDDFAARAAQVLEEPGAVLDMIAERRALDRVDTEAEAMLSQALVAMPQPLRRRVLLAYLGFPYYDIVTLPLARNEGLTEFEGVKIDRISPEDARSIRPGGTRATLRGTEFYNFGAFFSLAYRENDYLWGRLHGAERMIDLVCSTVPGGLAPDDIAGAKRAAFHAILAEERGRLLCDPGLIDRIAEEIDG